MVNDNKTNESVQNYYQDGYSVSAVCKESSVGSLVRKVFSINEVSAETIDYKAVNLTKSSDTVIKTSKGKDFTITFKFKNTGTYVWRKAGSNIMTLNVQGNKTSQFKNSYIVGNLSETIVYGGSTGTFKVTMKAPNKEGVFTEKYQMYIKSFGHFVAGSEISVTVDTTGSTTTTSADADKTEVKVEDVSYIVSNKEFKILDTKTSQTLVNVAANEKVNISFNQSTKEYIISKNGLIIASLKNEVIIDNSGKGNIDFGSKKDSSNKIALNSSFDIKQNANTVVCASSGCTSADTQGVQVPIIDTNNVTNNSTVINNGNYVVQNYLYASIPSEYKIRVGISNDVFPATFTSTSAFNVVDSTGSSIITVYSGEQVTIDYNKITQLYSVVKAGVTVKETTNYIKLQNYDTVNGVFTIVNMEKRPYWNSSINFNMYRGDLEIRYNSTYDKTWVINELNIEDYLKGMGEASNSSSYEYLKTMAVAERTYASYHYLSNKNSKSFFHVFSTESDQVYDGYNREIRQPNVVSAVLETKGVVMLYNNQLIQAFYSANAGGMTRSVSQAWGSSDLPYLQAVVDKYTTSDVRFGHGVGLSQVGAMRMIGNDSADYIKVLRYYYSGIDLKKIY